MNPGPRSKVQSPRSGNARLWTLDFGLWTCLLWLLLAVTGSHAQSALVVDAQDASRHFPDTVDFTLRAHGFEASRAELNYRLVGEPATTGEQAQVDSPTSNLDLKVAL